MEEQHRSIDQGTSLVVNVSSSDADMLSLTLPHMVEANRTAFNEVVVVIDEQPRSGRLITEKESKSPLWEVLAQLESQLPAMRVVTVDYEPHVRRRWADKWFGRRDMPIRCAGGTPIYAFIFGLESARFRYRVHVDCDMVFHDPEPRGWVTVGIDALTEDREVLFVSQLHGPPRTSEAGGTAPHLVQARQPFSTRCFLYDEAKLWEELDGFKIVKHALWKRPAYFLSGRSSSHALEHIIDHRLTAVGRKRCILEERFGFTLHAWDKEFFYDPRMPYTIDSIADGRVPAWQRGQENILRPWSAEDL